MFFVRSRAIELALIAVLAMSASAPAGPAIAQPVRHPTLRAELRLGALFYFETGGPTETVVARFTCVDPTRIELSLWLSQEELLRWLAAEPGLGSFRLQIHGGFVRLNASNFSFVEATGLWVASAIWHDRARAGGLAGEPFAVFADYTAIAVATPAFQTFLSPAAGDPGARIAFVRECARK